VLDFYLKRKTRTSDKNLCKMSEKNDTFLILTLAYLISDLCSTNVEKGIETALGGKKLILPLSERPDVTEVYLSLRLHFKFYKITLNKTRNFYIIISRLFMLFGNSRIIEKHLRCKL
jgi:hypothetical protein